MRATLDIRLRRNADGSVSAGGSLAVAPLWCRWDGATLWIVGSAASPVGEDQIHLRVDVGAGVHAAVRSVAASILYTGRGEGTALHTSIDVGPGAFVDWATEPVIVTAGALHATTTRVRAAAGSVVLVDEVVVLGRTGERCGTLRADIGVEIDGVPTLLTSFDTSSPGWHGAGGVAGARVTATRVAIGCTPVDRGAGPGSGDTPASRAALLHPEGGGHLGVCVADDPATARQLLDGLVRPRSFAWEDVPNATR